MIIMNVSTRPVSIWLSLFLLLLTTQVFAGKFEEGAYAAGKGDYATALRLWRPLARRGNVKAQYNLGLMYHQGLGVARNDRVAVQWWHKAAERGNAEAQANLGNMYSFGLGVPRNYKIAAKWYQSAANKGNVKAEYNLGFMYLKGNGKPRDYHLAMHWFRRAADQGDAYARFYMGLMYEQGQGVTPNPVAAFALYSLNPTKEHNLASVYRDRLIKILSITALNEAKTLTQKLRLAKPITKALDAYLAEKRHASRGRKG